MSGEATVAVVVVAAGSGSRAAVDGAAPKQYRPIGGRAVLARTLDAFLAHPRIGRVVVVIDPAHRPVHDAAVADFAADPRLAAPVAGGASRQASVLAGLEALAEAAPDLVLVHDAARPFVAAAVIDRCIARLADADGALVAIPVVDTLKRAGEEARIAATVSRDGLWAAQTQIGRARLNSSHEWISRMPSSA